jgi:hypothetical protein
MVAMCEKQGCDFSTCVTAQDKLNIIEAFEDEREAIATAEAQKKAEEEAYNAEMTAISLASIAASMEY